MKSIEYTVIPQESFDKSIITDVPYYFKGIKSQYLNSDFATFDSREFIRPSKTVEQTYHFYDLSMNHCDSWKDLPKRSKSLIGTTSLEIARTYGQNIYVCFLIDGSAYECPNHDIHFSFDFGIGKNLKGKKSSSLLLEYNADIVKFMRVLKWSEDKIRNCDYPSLLEFLQSNDFKNIKNKSKLMDWLNSGNSVESNVSKLFNPIENNFGKFDQNSNLASYGLGKEVFGSGKFIFVKYEIAKQKELISFS